MRQIVYYDVEFHRDEATKFAIAIAVVAPVAIATAGQALAAPVPPGAITTKAPAPTEVQYRTYFDYDYGPYTYRPACRYGGYTYWYPSYRNSAYPSNAGVACKATLISNRSGR